MESFISSLEGLWFEWLWPVLLVVIGLGAVVFFHELGHFLAARLVGIKVERFALGFGPRLFGVKLGETDFCLKLVPLGGYVKMLGQEDVKPLEEGYADPRAYPNKSVEARLLVIASGVVMNVIFGAVLFVIVCMVGIRFSAPFIGAVIPGMPAAEARVVPDAPATQPTPRPQAVSKGLLPGDEALSVDGKAVTRFEDVIRAAIRAKRDQVIEMRIRRRVEGRPVTGTAYLSLPPKGDAILKFGVGPASDTVFAAPRDLLTNDPFRPGDRVVAVNGHRIRHWWDVKPIVERLDGRPVTVVVERAIEGSDPPATHRVELTVQPTLYGREGVYRLTDGRAIRGRQKAATQENKEDKTVTIQTADGRDLDVPAREIAGTWYDDEIAALYPEMLDILGMVPRLKVQAVTKGSPAGRAGLRPGDVVVQYGDEPTPTLSQFHRISRKVGERRTRIVVLRDGKTEAIEIAPKIRHDQPQIGVHQGLDQGRTVVAGVRPGSPAETAGVEPGCTVTAVNGKAVGTWIDIYNAVRATEPQHVVRVTCRTGSETKTVELGKLTPDVFDAADYRFSLFPGYRVRSLEPLMGPKVQKGPLDAVVWGSGETWLFIGDTYMTIRGLLKGDVGAEHIGGPVKIGSIAIEVGRRSFIRLVYFMAMLSCMLAVFNFLPIPVVDGGHAVFLIVEKIRGKPLSVRVMNVIQTAGLVLILGVFVAITYKDIAEIVKGLW